MYGKNVLAFCALLFVASSSKHQLKSTSNKEIDDYLIIRYVLDENFMTNYSDETETMRYDLYEESINNTQNDELLTSFTSNDREDDDSVQYKLGTLFIENHENDSHMLKEFCTNSTKVNSKKNFTSQEIYTDLMRIEAFLMYYCYMASYFWLTVMSFDMWWTFKNLQSLQRNVKQREKKKLAIYSIYAWGFPFILAIVCGIMNFVPGIPKNLRPNFNCWFRGRMAFMLYFHVPRSICSISSICLSISTALKIRRYEKDAARYLRDSESQRYNENKKWFNLYLKLFIMTFIIMGIRLFMTTWHFLYKSIYWNDYYKNIFAYLSYSTDFMLNLGIFIIFVCKKTIMRLLLKRFGCQKCHKVDATSSSTCTTTSGGISMQENISSYRQTNFDAIHSSDVTEL